MKKLGVYAVATPKLTEYQSDIDMDGSQWKSLIGGNMWMDNYECMFAVDTSYPIQDDFYQESKIYQEYAPQVRFTFLDCDCNRICNACNSGMADNCCRQIKPGRRHCVKSGRQNEDRNLYSFVGCSYGDMYLWGNQFKLQSAERSLV